MTARYFVLYFTAFWGSFINTLEIWFNGTTVKRKREKNIMSCSIMSTNNKSVDIREKTNVKKNIVKKRNKYLGQWYGFFYCLFDFHSVL